MRAYVICWLAVIRLLTLQLSSAGAPVFGKLPTASIPLREDIRVQTSFFEVTATDPDGDRLQYSIVGPAGAPFVINPYSGIVSVRNNPGLDYEAINKYQLHISVNDSTQAIVRNLEVEIVDVDETPVFVTLPSAITLPEDFSKAAVLLNVTATDPEHQPVTYTLTAPLGVPFDVSPQGLITIRADPNLNFEARRQITLTIAATDGTLSTLSAFTINITDVNEPPEILNMGAKITVPKDTVGSIFKVNAIDEDNNDKLTYSMVIEPEFNTTAEEPFSINPATGELIVKTPPGLDPYQENLYELHITATDTAGHNTTGILYVEVVHYMNIPEIWNLHDSRFLYENRTEGAMIFTPRTIDLTAGGKLSYKMKVYPPEGKFTIDPDTGHLWVRDDPNFDFEKTYKYEIEIIVSNGVTTSKPRLLHVRIVDTNEKPIITSVQTLFTVPEDTRKPTKLHKVTAKDPDDMTTLTFSLKVEPASGQNKFVINPLNGQVSVSANPDLDFETLDEYTLIVTASDGVLTSDPFKMRVDITDANEPPEYSTDHLEVWIPEEMPVGDVIPVSCDASDPDAWDKALLYQMIMTKYSDFVRLDSTRGCRLKVAKTMDSESPTSPENMSLEIIAVDSRGLVAKLFLHIHVDNINDNSPEFLPTNYEANLLESSPVGSYVAQVSARDKDVGEYGQMTYRIYPADRHFRVSQHGDIFVRARLDRETTEKLSFKVVASDKGSPPRSDTATVTVYLEDSNDHRPTFVKRFYDFEARYDTEIGTPVGRITATDLDDDKTELHYKLLGISEEFGLHPGSGEIRTTGSLTPDTRYLLQAVAQDTGTPPQTSKAVTIRVDTYTCKESLVRMEVNQAYFFFDDSGKARFARAIRDEVFPGFVPKVERIRTGQKAGTSVVLMYFLRSNHTDDVTMVSEKKSFVSVTEILFSSNTGQDGGPSLRFMTGSFVGFPVTGIGRECPIEKTNWWLDTQEGRVTLGVLSTMGAVLLLGALSYLGRKAISRLNLFKSWRHSRISPPAKGTLRTIKPPAYKDNQNWWKLKPKAAFESHSALEEKFQPPADRPVSSTGVKLRAPQPGSKSISGRPLPGGQTGMEF